MSLINNSSLMDRELTHLFLSFCSFVTLMHTDKLNLANIFLLLLQNSELRCYFKKYCDVSNDYAVVLTFLKFDHSLYKSKYITKYLNNSKNKIII